MAPAETSTAGDRVVVLDLAKRTEKTVATLRPDHSLFDVEGDGTTVVYVEEDRRATDSDPMINWTMKAVDLGTGVTTTIASSAGSVHYALAPTPTIRLPWIAWSEPIPVPEGQRVDSRVVSYNAESKERHVISSPGGTNSTLAMLGPSVVFDHNQSSDRSRYDVYSRPVDASAPAVMLTNSGEATQPFAGDGWIGWEGMSHGYESIWIMKYDPRAGRRGRAVNVDPQSEGNGRLGKGFIMWLSFGGPLELQPLSESANAGGVVNVEPRETLTIAGRWDAWNDMIAWVALVNGAPVVKVATVVLG